MITSISQETQHKIIEFLADDHTGVSSETMAFWLGFGVKKRRHDHPYDPADFNRCLVLLNRAPELRAELHKMAQLSAEWASLVLQWDRIEKCHLEEVGLNWEKYGGHVRAEKTYDLIKEAINVK